jgi:hypothetical protein
MKAHRMDRLDAPFGGLDSVGARGYAFPPETSRAAAGRGAAIVVLKSSGGFFGWRLTGRQAALLLRAGFTCRSCA